MPLILQTIDEYTVKERKKDTYWLVFNTVYNDVHAFKKELDSEDGFSLYLDKKNTDTLPEMNSQALCKQTFQMLN